MNMDNFKSSWKSAFKKKDKPASHSNGNDTKGTLGHHANASSIGRSGIATVETPLPPVSSFSTTRTFSSTSVVNLNGYVEPPPATTAVELAAAPSLAATSPVSTMLSSLSAASPVPTMLSPQLTEDSPLIRTQRPPSVSGADTRPTESSPRAPHGSQPNQSESVAHAAFEQDLSGLHRSSTLPPSYNSLDLPLANRSNFHEASAPSPYLVNVTTAQHATAFENSPALSSVSMPYVLPPPTSPLAGHLNPNPNQHATFPPLPGQSPLQQQGYYPPTPSPDGPFYKSHSPGPSISGIQHYSHKPYIAPGSENQTYPIIMAIDWGTTYSSMAYAYQQDGEVHEVSTWPKQTHNYPKVPTCNLYSPGSKEIIEWGYTANTAITKPPYKSHVLLSKYKLHLDEASGPHPPLPNGLTIVDAIADYLRLFHSHVLQAVLKGFGSAFDQNHIQYCLSVPAMWTDSAKALMRQAALQAGIISPLDPPHRLLLISEPEAAALYCEKKCDQFQISHGQRFMICDAGGGTVDLIVFEVAVGPQGRTLREVTRGSGHSCGSIFLDERMEALLRRRFARWQEKGLTPANWLQLMETFIHNIKPLFDGIEDQYITMPAVPGRADLTDYDIGLEDGVLTVTAEEMRREVFDPVVDDVLRLIQHQLQQTNNQCHAILMVGGFGCSSYLYTRVKSEFGSRVPIIGVPPRAELAVVRGAVYAGLMPRTVTQRVARRWYGVDSLMTFEEGVDSPLKKSSNHDGQVRARDRFSVYVAPGQSIGIDECITKRYITYQYPKPVNSPLYACSSMNQPRYVDSPMVEKIGDFMIPLPFVQGAKKGDKMLFELRMYFGATEIRAEAEINGVIVSTRCQFAG